MLLFALFPSGGSFPCVIARSASTSPFSRPAQRSLTLRPAHSRSRLTTLSIAGFGWIVAYHPLQLLPAGATRAGRDLHPLEKLCLHTAHQYALRAILLRPCMGLSKSSGFFGRQLLFFVPYFCWPVSRFDCGTVSPSRARREAIRVGRGHRVDRCRSDQKRSSPAAAELSVPQQPCIRYEPLSGVGDHDAVMRIDGEAPKGGPILQATAQGPWAQAGHRHLGSSSATSRPKADARRIGLSPGCLHRACLSLKLSRRSEPDEASCPPAPCRW